MKFKKLETAKVLKKEQMKYLFGGDSECTVCSHSGCKQGCKPGNKQAQI